MDQDISQLSATLVDGNDRSYEPPKFEVISLDCEITAYAPDDGDAPLF
jgi:hypothetical protein